MTRWALILAGLIATPAVGQVVSPLNQSSAASVDMSAYATKTEVAAARTVADNAARAAASTVKVVNGIAPDSNGAVSVPIPAAPDLSGYATMAAVSSAVASATASTVKTVNGVAPVAGAVTLAIPTPSNTTPPGVADAGAVGTMSTMYALANHTHASKARRIIATSAADGSYTFNYASTPFTNPPVCTAVAEVAAGVTDVVNVQIVATPSTTSASFLVNRTNRSAVSLIGLTVLSLPAQPGATKIHAICLEP